MFDRPMGNTSAALAPYFDLLSLRKYSATASE
jgi:hypothetical protein